MTEKEWLEAQSPLAMLDLLRGPVDGWPPPELLAEPSIVPQICPGPSPVLDSRRFALIGRAFVQFLRATAPAAVPVPLWHAFDQLASGTLGEAEFRVWERNVTDFPIPELAHSIVQIGGIGTIREPYGVAVAALVVADSVALQLAENIVRGLNPSLGARSNWECGVEGPAVPEWQAARSGALAHQAALLREIVGNPFRPVALDSAWLTSNVLALARTIDADEAFDRLPILADALMDAGCTNDELLKHCRQTDGHVRGCWAIDLLLGRE